MAGLLRVLKQKWYPPAAETTSFTGRTVLITGATTGLGLEAAKKIACLEPQTLIITARGKERGEKAVDTIKRHFENATPKAQPPQIHLLILNMSTFDSVTEFVDMVTVDFPSLDTVILNAGCALSGWLESSNGWEEQLQVNCLSTTLLTLLLLKKLLASLRTGSSYIPRLEIVTSGLARMETTASMATLVQADNPLSKLNDKALLPDVDSISSSRKRYALSKVAMEVNMRHIAALPSVKTQSNTPKVIVNSACPGLCYTDLSRDMAKTLPMKIVVGGFFTVFGRSAEQGSNSLVSGLTRNVDGHGKMWKDDQLLDAGEFLESEDGKAFGDKIWRETCEVLLAYDSSLAAIL